MQKIRQCRLVVGLIVIVLFGITAPSALARGSFGGGGHSFGGGGSRPSFTPPPRPSFTPPPAPAFVPHPSFAPAPSPGSFGKGGNVGSPVSNHFSATPGEGGSFGKTGTAGSRTFASVGSHPYAPPPAMNVGHPYTPALAHPYYYGGRPTNAYFSGGYNDYSFGYYRHPYYGWSPWSPVFYYNPPYYNGGGYVSGGFSFFHLLLGIVFWLIVIAIVIALFRRMARRA